MTPSESTQRYSEAAGCRITGCICRLARCRQGGRA